MSKTKTKPYVEGLLMTASESKYYVIFKKGNSFKKQYCDSFVSAKDIAFDSNNWPRLFKGHTYEGMIIEIISEIDKIHYTFIVHK